MALGKLEKQPFEELDCAVDFKNTLAPGTSIESIYSVTAVNAETGTSTGAAVISASPAPSISGTRVQFRAKDGVDRERHKISIRIVASNGEKIEADILLVVKES